MSAPGRPQGEYRSAEHEGAPASGMPAVDADWSSALRRRIDLPPERPRLPLTLQVGGAAARAIGSIEADLARELAAAGLALRDAGATWQIEAPTLAAVDPTLAALAAHLRAIGRASAWRDELLDVADADGTVVGAIERAAVRPLGIATVAVHLVVADPTGRVWVQQRAPDKAVDPGRWDTTMGGLMAAGETVAETLARETWEEAGLRLDQLTGTRPFGRCTVRRPLAEGYMVEHIEMVEAVALAGAVPVNQDGEVAGFEALARPELVARLHADAFTLEAATILVHWLGRPG